MPKTLQQRLRAMPRERLSCGQALDRWALSESLSEASSSALEDLASGFDDELQRSLEPERTSSGEPLELANRFGVDAGPLDAALREHLAECPSCRRVTAVVGRSLRQPKRRLALPARTLRRLQLVARSRVLVPAWVREPRLAVAASLLLLSVLSPWVLKAQGEAASDLGQKVTLSSQRLLASLDSVETLAGLAFRPPQEAAPGESESSENPSEGGDGGIADSAEPSPAEPVQNR
ncbi:MAG: hypothetical protein AAGD01_18975 [Acidobacteriota bacterium]